MKKEGYEYFNENDILYTFLSKGKKDIPKVVYFQKIESDTFNLVLSDIDLENQSISDKIISNNGDISKVLATVFHITLDFIHSYPNCYVIITGNTTTKKLLYKRLINNYFSEVRNFVQIKVLLNKVLVDYEIGIDCDLFYICKKNNENE